MTERANDALAERCGGEWKAMREAGWHVTAGLLAAAEGLLNGMRIEEVSAKGTTIEDIAERCRIHARKRDDDELPRTAETLRQAASALEAMAALEREHDAPQRAP